MAVISESDEPHGELGINNENFAASSSSSLSSSASLEAVTAPTTNTGNLLSPRQWLESDDENNDFEADWSSNVSPDVLQTLSVAEKKRQEVINEIYQTERNHVRTLRLLEGIFMRPLQDIGVLSADDLNLLFPPALIVLKDLHGSFEQQLKQRRQDHGALIGNIGDLLVTMFDGRCGEELREHAAQFCARQQIALEALKEKRRKDDVLQRLLTKAESHKACRRLQLKDLLPTALQRLTKYPLLFESLVKITTQVAPDNEKEAQDIHRALESSRRILNHVNQAVRIAEDTHKLQAIQKKLDKSSYEKDSNNEFKNLDLTQHKLIYDGPLIMKKNPGIQLHGLLFESMMVLLIKQDDKYILKNQASPGLSSGESKSNDGRFNPITKINLIFVRQSAVEKNSFFLINTNVSQMLELTAPSSSECKTWFKHISETAEAYKARIKCSNDVTNDDTANIQADVKEDADGGQEKVAAAALPATMTVTQSPITRNSSQKGENGNAEPFQDIEHKHSIGKGDIERNDHVDNTQKYTDDSNANDEDGAAGKEPIIRSGPPIYSNSTNSNITRTLTQQSSLVSPSEISVSISPTLTAEPVITPGERLQRLNETIRMLIAEKQKIVCDMFKVPDEHFNAIADIAGQPEASKDPTETVLAAFAQLQSLTEALNEYTNVPLRHDLTSISAAALCDDCHRTRISQSKCANSSSSNSSTTATTVVRNADEPPSDQTSLTQDDDGYCEIDEIRMPNVHRLSKKAAKNAAKKSAAVANDGKTETTPTDNDGVGEATDGATDTSTNTITTIATTTDVAVQPIGSNEIDKELFAIASVVNDVNDHTSTAMPDTVNESNPIVSSSKLVESQDEHIEINDAYDTISQRIPDDLNADERVECASDSCPRKNPVLPSIPCHLITTHVSALNQHISTLLPRLHERDNEREELRRDNQRLRERLNSMHERELKLNNEESTENRNETDAAN